MGLNVHASPLIRVGVGRFPVSGGPVVQTAALNQNNAKYLNTSTKIQQNSKRPNPNLNYGVAKKSVIVINLGSNVHCSPFRVVGVNFLIEPLI
jgi:hypothetical protein